MKLSDWAVLALVVLGSMDTAALGARIAGFELAPAIIFFLVVLGAPIPLVLAVLPQFGVRSVTLPSEILPVPVPAPPAQPVTGVVLTTEPAAS